MSVPGDDSDVETQEGQENCLADGSSSARPLDMDNKGSTGGETYMQKRQNCPLHNHTHEHELCWLSTVHVYN